MKHSSHRPGPRSSSASTGKVRSLIRSRAANLRAKARELQEHAAERSHLMHETAAETRTGSRRRALVPVAIGFAGLGGMFGLVSANVMAVNFTTGNNSFQLYSNYLDAFQAAGFLDSTSQQDGSNVGVAELGINTAKLGGLCAIAHETILGLADYSLVIKAGQGVAPAFTGTSVPTPASGTLNTNADGTINTTSSTGIVSANQLFINSNLLTGYGNLISGLNLGENASQVGADAGVASGFAASGNQAPVPGNFGLYAKQLNVAGLSGSTYGINLAGQITLPQLSITVVPGSKTQADC